MDELPVALEAMPDDGKRAYGIRVQRLAQIINQNLRGIGLVKLLKVCPFFRLCVLYEGNEDFRIKADVESKSSGLLFLKPPDSKRYCSIAISKAASL